MRTHIDHVQGVLLRAVADVAGVDPSRPDRLRLVIRELACRDWASVTLAGARHALDIALAGDPVAISQALARLAVELPDREIPICGHFVAELSVVIGESACSTGSGTEGDEWGDDGQGVTIHALVISD